MLLARLHATEELPFGGVDGARGACCALATLPMLLLKAPARIPASEHHLTIAPCTYAKSNTVQHTLANAPTSQPTCDIRDGRPRLSHGAELASSGAETGRSICMHESALMRVNTQRRTREGIDGGGDEEEGESSGPEKRHC